MSGDFRLPHELQLTCLSETCLEVITFLMSYNPLLTVLCQPQRYNKRRSK